MNIVVCVKQVPDTNLQIRLNKEGSDIDRDNLSFVISPYDEFAVEEALRIREKFPGSLITALTLGPSASDEVLRQALAMGADEAVHILDSNVAFRDSLITAKALASVIATFKPDLVLCGRQAVDDDAFQVGGALGPLLGFPEISVACKITVSSDGGELEVERILEGGIKQVLQTRLPCVVTCQKGINEPRYPSLPGIMKAKKKEVRLIQIEELKLDLHSLITAESFEIPQIRRGQRLIDGEPAKQVSELARLLREEAKVV